MMLPINAIREDGDVRHIAVDPSLDAALTGSIGAQGVLVPILVTPDGDTGNYIVLAGRRRLRCARAAGLAEIPAEVQTIVNGWTTAAALAENMVRAPLHPLDQWRGVKSLLDQGMEIRVAAAAVGLDDRQTRQMERLGSLHPTIQKLIEQYDDMPEGRELRIIANAPPELQAKAAKINGIVHEWNGNKSVNWSAVSEACAVKRFSRTHAVFDPKLIEWDHDWLAQPGAPDEYSTDERETFIKLQEKALDDIAFEMAGKKKRVEIVGTAGYSLAIPKGFNLHTSGPFAISDPLPKPKGHDVLFLGIRENGSVGYAIATDVKSAAAAEKKRAEKAKTSRIDAENPDDQADVGDDDATEDRIPPAAPEKREVTKAGLDIVNAAKTKALQETLRSGLAEVPPEKLLAIMLLALAANNVRIDGTGLGYMGYGIFKRFAGRLLLPGGGLWDLSMADARSHAGDALARFLKVGTTGNSYNAPSGEAAEWIGAAIGADAAVERLDSEAFLATVSGDELRRAAESIGEKTSGTLKDLRARLVGRLPDWRPNSATFGAPAPVVTEEDPDDE